MVNGDMNLPSRLASSIARWNLQLGSRLAGGFRSEVFACTTAGGEDVVLKLTGTLEESRAEAAALGIWAGTAAAVRLLDEDVERGALLLERIRPGRPLPGGDDPTAIEVAADLLRKLHGAPPGGFSFPSLRGNRSQPADRRPVLGYR